MTKLYYKFLFWGILYIFLHHYAAAQSTLPPNLPLCGTPDLTRAQALSLTQQANAALQRKRATGATFNTITYVPIRPHIFRQSNGTGGFSLADLNQVIALTNSYYLLNGYGIQFYFAGTTPNYIDDDGMYNQYNGQSVDAYDANNALNQYYVHQFSDLGLGGYAYYPADGIYSTRSFILTGSGEYIEDLGNRLIPHELGHTFNLIHTFGQNGGSGVLGSGTTTELVTRGAGANCLTDGDLVCDTPADPYNMTGAYLTYVNGCPQYDPSSSARDANGDVYTPSITNIMSYYFPCTHDFTPGQFDRIQAGLALRQSHTTYTLNAPATAMTAPSNLTASYNGLSVTLNWQDNSSNEMGYFIERSLVSNAGFTPIGGVAPNVTTFTDTKASANVTYYYRIRPSNTTTGSLSIPVSITTTPPTVTGLTTTNITGSSAQLNWNILDSDITYDVQWRAAGTTTWNTLSNIFGNSYYLYNLQPSTAYEWQVKVSSSDTYSGPLIFSTTCPTPSFPSSYPYRSTAQLYWSSYVNQTFTIQWRQQGNSAWNTITGLTSSYYSLTGLTSSTVYEWQVQGVCSTTATTDYTSPQSFTTKSCDIPTTPTSSYIGISTARVYWYTSYYDSDRTYEVRYRPVNTINWTTISSLTATTSSLTGLTNNTQYEWQVRSVCGPSESSDFTTLATFTTSCVIPYGLYGNPTATSAFISWSANYVEPGATYEIQFRPTGSQTWSTVSNPSTYTSLTGLATNTTYEWRVRTICSVSEQSDYSSINTFTTGCKTPDTNLVSISDLSSASVQLNWYLTSDPGTLFDIRYRPVGSANWTTVSSVTATTSNGSYRLTGLTNNTTYEWQIRTVCSPNQQSDYTQSLQFTTQCVIPYSLYTNTLVTAATLTWNNFGPDVTYDVQYQQSGTNSWTTLTNLTSNTVAITGLTGSTGYEWKVRSHCNDGTYTDYSYVSYFYTNSCSSPSSLTTTEQTTTSAKINWYFYYASVGTMYEGRYRVVGTTDWTYLGNLSSTNGYGYFTITGLTPTTSYEWQIRTLCSANESSAFSNSTYFQTYSPCNGMYTIKAGQWDDPAVWSCNRIPTSTDDVQIKHVVSLPAYYTANVHKIQFDIGQQLVYAVYSRLKLGF
ncbi:fibronectin type III domain-containing protein [Spirosoma sp. SC4-14]|uniref:fibronectin type III domain-containing protein n=1 Tax=Spirosoma sp. SC4-14 TaxID=3128900 RepID=UPI0030D3170F